MRTILMSLAALGLFAVGTAQGEVQTSVRTVNRQTLVTFSGPVRLPSVVLAAGTYQFRYADPTNGPRSLAVLSEDGATVVAVVDTTATPRTETAENHENIIGLRATGPGEPPELDVWFWFAHNTPIGDEDTGCQVIYPKRRDSLAKP